MLKLAKEINIIYAVVFNAKIKKNAKIRKENNYNLCSSFEY